MTQEKGHSKTAETQSLREVLIGLLVKWPWFVVSFAFFIGIALLYLQTTDIKYTVNSTILLRSNKSKSMLGDQSAVFESLGFASLGSKQIDDEIQVLRSGEIMKSVIHALELNTEYYETKKLRKVDVYPVYPFKIEISPFISDTLKKIITLKVKKSQSGYRVKFEYDKIKEKYEIKDLNETIKTPIGDIKFNKKSSKDLENAFTVKHYPIQHIVEKLTSKIKVLEVNKRANAIKITTDAPNTKKAIDIINKLIEFYNLDAVVDKNLFASNAASFIDERLQLIKLELFEAERDIEDYKKKHQLTDFSTELKLLLETNVEYQKEIEKIETQLRIIEFIEDQLKKDATTTIPLNVGLESDALNALLPHYNENILMKIKLERTALPDNPTLTITKIRIDEYRKNILNTINSVRQSLKITLNGIKEKDDVFVSKIKGIPTNEREFHEINRQQYLKHSLYMFLMQKKEENAMTLASAVPTAKILSKPTSSILPSSPKSIVILGLAFVFGLAFPIFLIHILDLINNKISDKRELIKLVDAPYLGSIMTVKDDDKIQVREGVTTPIVELFRLIRTNLQFMLSGKKSPVILVTSSIGGEGKSFTSINLAMSFALMQQKVVLVGLDIRKPMLGEYLHISKSKGVSLYLSDKNYKLSDVILPSGFHPSLSVIPAGPIPPNPGELLMSERLDEMFAELKKEFDYIIVDSAPIGKVSDTYLLNRIVDNTVYVTRQNFTPREVTELINDIYEHKKLKNIGVVLNGVSHSASSGYGYGYGYN
jgi:capsular exopolysaccharide synthesis family protein